MVSEAISVKVNELNIGLVHLQGLRQPRCPHQRRRTLSGLTAITSLTSPAPDPKAGWTLYADRTCPTRPQLKTLDCDTPNTLSHMDISSAKLAPGDTHSLRSDLTVQGTITCRTTPEPGTANQYSHLSVCRSSVLYERSGGRRWRSGCGPPPLTYPGFYLFLRYQLHTAEACDESLSVCFSVPRALLRLPLPKNDPRGFLDSSSVSPRLRCLTIASAQVKKHRSLNGSAGTRRY